MSPLNLPNLHVAFTSWCSPTPWHITTRDDCISFHSRNTHLTHIQHPHTFVAFINIPSSCPVNPPDSILSAFLSRDTWLTRHSHLSNTLQTTCHTLPALPRAAYVLPYASLVNFATPCHATTISNIRPLTTNTSCHKQTVLCHTLCIVITPAPEPC